MNEFKYDFLPALKDFSIKAIARTINIPQVNSIHQVWGNMLQRKNLQKYDFDDMDPWSKLLALVACAISST